MDVADDGSSVDRPRRIEVLNGPERRRHWSDEAKARIVAESVLPGAVVSQVARRHDVLPSQIYAWRNVRFEWRTKRDAMRIELSDEGYLVTFPPTLPSVLDESEGYMPANFDRLIEISGESGSILEVDENTLLEAMPDFLLFLPRE